MRESVGMAFASCLAAGCWPGNVDVQREYALPSGHERGADVGAIEKLATGVTVSPPAPDDALAVREAAIRAVIAGRPRVKYWFIDFGEPPAPGATRDLRHVVDPPPGFAARFSDMGVPVAPVSAAWRRAGGGITDVSGRHRAWIVFARVRRRIDESAFEVEYADWHGPEAASGGVGVLRKKDGRWVLTPRSGWES